MRRGALLGASPRMRIGARLGSSPITSLDESLCGASLGASWSALDCQSECQSD